MRIDAHVRLSPHHPPAHLRTILERNRFDGAILVADASELPAMEPPLSGLVVRSRRGVDPSDYRALPGFCGMACSLEDGIPDGLEQLARLELPLDVEMRSIHFPAVLQLAERLPGLRLAIDHLARPDFQAGWSEPWALAMEAAARLPQMYCKISGLLTEGAPMPWSAAPLRPFVRHALELFGPARVMFGSDWPACLPDATWKESLAAFTQSIGAQSLEVREQLLGETARRFYRI